MLNHLRRLDKLREAIDRNNLELVKPLMTRNPKLHLVSVGSSGGKRLLPGVAECQNSAWGSGGSTCDGEVDDGERVGRASGRGCAADARGAHADSRISMMDLLVLHGADVNARG